MRGARQLTGLVGIAAACAALLGAADTHAATIEPTVKRDEPPTRNGNCTLREAVIAANEDRRVDRCRRGRGADVIRLRRGTYRLSVPGPQTEPLVTEDDPAGGDLDVFENLRILGHHRRTTIDARPQLGDRHLQLFGGRLTARRLTLLHGSSRGYGGSISLLSGRAKLIGVRMRKNEAGFGSGGGSLFVGANSRATMQGTQVAGSGANEGGGIYVHGRLRGIRIQVRGNDAQAAGAGLFVASEGELRLDRSAVTGNVSGLSGGGLYAGPGTFTRIKRSEFLGNRADEDGGGIFLDNARMNISASTLATNTAEQSGGGLSTDNTLSGAPRLRIVNTTISQNDAGTGGGGLALASSGGTKTILSSTISGNVALRGGGILGPPLPGDPGGFTARGSIIAANRATFTVGTPGHDCLSQAPAVSTGFNLFRTLEGCTLSPRQSDIVGKKPKLGRLRPNGGPTLTRALRKGSPAINRGPKNAPKRDQRGKKRKGRPDIGAYERR